MEVIKGDLPSLSEDAPPFWRVLDLLPEFEHDTKYVIMEAEMEYPLTAPRNPPQLYLMLKPCAVPASPVPKWQPCPSPGR